MTTQAIDFESLRRPDPPPPGRYRYVVSWLDTSSMSWRSVRSQSTCIEWADAMRAGLRKATTIGRRAPRSCNHSVHAVAC